MESDFKAINELNKKFKNSSPENVLRDCINSLFKEKVAYVCSFGAESAIILDIISKIDKTFPVILLNTMFLFNETLEYKNTILKKLGLTNCVEIFPDSNNLNKKDRKNDLWETDPDKCCNLRKVLPLKLALEKYDAWISGRKSYHKGERTNLQIFESLNDKIVINPLINFDTKKINKYFEDYKLPRHPLYYKNYFSIGCTNCTIPSNDLENVRSGRWKNTIKTECGIHYKEN